MIALVLAPTGARCELPRVTVTQPASGEDWRPPVIGAGAPVQSALSFTVVLSYGCPAATEPKQLFLSVAETWRTIDANGQQSPLVTTLDVPIRQLQWLTQPEAECRNVIGKRSADILETGVRYFRLHGATAYAMLTCAGKSGRSAATSSATLDVLLSCPVESEKRPEP